jgi:hypothetical protein
MFEKQFCLRQQGTSSFQSVVRFSLAERKNEQQMQTPTPEALRESFYKETIALWLNQNAR